MRKLIVLLLFLSMTVPAFASIAKYPTFDVGLSQSGVNYLVSPIQRTHFDIGVEFPIVNAPSSIYFNFQIGSYGGVSENGGKIGYKYEIR